ncbi:hypothetical protein QQF64_020093 [Cirrhinus molitorella]|uniref:Uncharacterized protein n=1 Tax=Cirrhinus molitorella TaxID=172907 RepID=A0ABR3LL14_9TELE
MEVLASPPELDIVHRSLASKPSPGEKLWPVILRFHRFQVKDLEIHKARKRGPLLYKGHTIRLFDDCTRHVEAAHRVQRSHSRVIQAWIQAGAPLLSQPAHHFT